MTSPLYQLPHAGIQSLQPYTPGKSIESLAQEKGLTDIIKLASNENPLGCSPLVKQALMDLSPVKIATYPSAVNHPVRAKLAQKLHVPLEHVFLSNGSDSVFWFLLTLFGLGKTQPMITHVGAFISYAVQAQTLGIPVIKTEVKEDFGIDVEKLAAACRYQPSMMFFANPNNPTGLAITQEELQWLLHKVPSNTIVVLDEAYHEFAHPQGDMTSLQLLKQFPNLVITRTFSKIYGLASLRLGYAVAAPEIVELLIRIQPPFTVNHAAMSAAEAAMDDHHFVKQTLQLCENGRRQLEQGLANLQYSFLPSLCNFVTIACGQKSMAIYEGLLEQGVIVRPLQAYDMPGYLRVSIGTEEQNNRFLTSLKHIGSYHDI